MRKNQDSKTLAKCSLSKVKKLLIGGLTYRVKYIKTLYDSEDKVLLADVNSTELVMRLKSKRNKDGRFSDILHEFLHVQYPKWAESKIVECERAITAFLLDNNLANLRGL